MDMATQTQSSATNHYRKVLLNILVGFICICPYLVLWMLDTKAARAHNNWLVFLHGAVTGIVAVFAVITFVFFVMETVRYIRSGKPIDTLIGR